MVIWAARLTSQRLALRSIRVTKVPIHRSRHCECIPIPVLRTSLILIASCPVRGASRGVTEVGQSESLAGAGQPKPVGCGVRGCASQAQTRRLRGCRPGPLRGSATELAGRGQAAAGNRRAARQPSPRKNGPLATNPAMERPKGAFVYYQGALFGAPSPLKKGRSTKSLTRAAARGCGRLAV
jgi:hypothetical protein